MELAQLFAHLFSSFCAEVAKTSRAAEPELHTWHPRIQNLDSIRDVAPGHHSFPTHSISALDVAAGLGMKPLLIPMNQCGPHRALPWPGLFSAPPPSKPFLPLLPSSRPRAGTWLRSIHKSPTALLVPSSQPDQLLPTQQLTHSIPMERNPLPFP